MTTEHTPGPWMMGQNNCYETALLGRNGEVIAFAAWDGGSCCHLEIENEANARLIAAAPELLEALEELHLKAVVGTDDERHAALHKAWAAIAKAKGAA